MASLPPRCGDDHPVGSSPADGQGGAQALTHRDDRTGRCPAPLPPGNSRRSPGDVGLAGPAADLPRAQDASVRTRSRLVRRRPLPLRRGRPVLRPAHLPLALNGGQQHPLPALVRPPGPALPGHHGLRPRLPHDPRPRCFRVGEPASAGGGPSGEAARPGGRPRGGAPHQPRDGTVERGTAAHDPRAIAAAGPLQPSGHPDEPAGEAAQRAGADRPQPRLPGRRHDPAHRTRGRDAPRPGRHRLLIGGRTR